MITFEVEGTLFHKPIYIIQARGYFKDITLSEYRLATLNPQELPRHCGVDITPRTFYFRATFIVERTITPFKFLKFFKYKKRSYVHFVLNSFQHSYYFDYQILHDYEIVCGEYIAEYTINQDDYTKYLFDKQLNDLIKE